MEKDYSKLHFVIFFVQKKAERKRGQPAVRPPRDVPIMNRPPHGNPATREDAVYRQYYNYYNYEARQSSTYFGKMYTWL